MQYVGHPITIMCAWSEKEARRNRSLIHICVLIRSETTKRSTKLLRSTFPDNIIHVKFQAYEVQSI